MSVFVAAVFDIFNFEKTEHGVGTLTELSGLIGTSWGGLDHPEEIHGTNCRGTEHLDLIGTSHDGLNHPEEIHGIDGSGTDELAGHRSHCMTAVCDRDDGFFAAIGEKDGKCLRWWRRRRSKPNDRRTVDMVVEVSGMQLSWGVEMLRENHLLSGERGSFRGF
ncbi:hypothetical protein COP2_007878 [Malus domestica]|uniref:Uncharacterized protein n=1 Tax=Malus domestica TaxID=3750 RepID=A0A498IIW3_MALDO|nr:hypothetical protein DVH24_003648 [Malus domestica]